MEEAFKKATEGIKNKGHRALLDDLMSLVFEAVRGEFHDFLNTKYPTPKITLRNKLHILADNVVQGKYDN